MKSYVVGFDQLGKSDIETVGGKNASLGEMISNLAELGVAVPDGFATTADAYRDFLRRGGLDDRIHGLLAKLDVEDLDQLAETGSRIRRWVMENPLPDQLQQCRPRVEVVERDVEESLDLCGVKIDGNDTVEARCGDQVGH